MTATAARPATSSRCWAGFHLGHRLGCTTADCACPCHTVPATATPVVETPAGTAPEDCGALASGYDVCLGECDACHVYGRRTYVDRPRGDPDELHGLGMTCGVDGCPTCANGVVPEDSP